ncbi:MAG: hypothetical protein J0L63_18735 [Anaerolineae bacterium]|nr:hypothetical protein [Anaerolineae bacterium]
MPLLSRYYIKAGMLYLLLALLANVLLASSSTLGLPPAINTLRPVYFHLLMVGWVTELIFGVAYWMFPKFTRELPRGNPLAGWATFGLLNIGLIVRVVAEPLVTIKPEWNLGWLLVVSALCQLAAVWLFVVNTWPRIKER